MTSAPGTLGRVVLGHDRRHALGVEQQEFAPPLPRPLLDQRRLDAEFAERQAYEPRMRAEGMMIKRDHAEAARLTLGEAEASHGAGRVKRG